MASLETFVKHIFWHRIAATAPNGDAITACGQQVPPSTITASPDLVEPGNGCGECVPEKASKAELKAARETAKRRAAEAEAEAEAAEQQTGQGDAAGGGDQTAQPDGDATAADSPTSADATAPSDVQGAQA